MPQAEPLETEASQSDALNRLLTEQPSKKVETLKKKKDDGNYIIWILAPILLILVIGISIVVFKYHSDKEKTELKQLPVKPKSSSTPVVTPAPTPKPAVSADSTRTESSKPTSEEPKANKETAKSASAKPKTHVLGKGESLTRVSQKYYGTKDSVRAIIRVNKFPDPDNVPYGTEIILP